MVCRKWVATAKADGSIKDRLDLYIQMKNVVHPLDPEFLHVEINPEEIIQQGGKDVCAKVFIAAIFYGGIILLFKKIPN